MASRRLNAIVSILFVVFGGPGFVLVYFPFWITRFRMPASEPIWQMALAAVLILTGLVPLFESIVRFVRIGRGTLVPTTPTEELVVSGLYRYVRNPMYAGVLTVLAGELLLFESGDLASTRLWSSSAFISLSACMRSQRWPGVMESNTGLTNAMCRVGCRGSRHGNVGTFLCDAVSK